MFLRHTIASKCSSSFCAKNKLEEEFKSYPSFDCKSQHDFIENIKQWLEGRCTSNCRKRINDGVVSENDTHWEFCDKVSVTNLILWPMRILYSDFFIYLSCVGSNREGNTVIDDICKLVHRFHWSEL